MRSARCVSLDITPLVPKAKDTNSAVFSRGCCGAEFTSASFPASNARCAYSAIGPSSCSFRAILCKRSTFVRSQKNRAPEIRHVAFVDRGYRWRSRRGCTGPCQFVTARRSCCWRYPRSMLRASDALPRHDSGRWPALGACLFFPALARWTSRSLRRPWFENSGGYARHRPRALPRIDRLSLILRRAAGFDSRDGIRPSRRSTTIQPSTRACLRWVGGHRRRLGVRPMDGQSKVFPAHCGARRFFFARCREDLTLRHRGYYRRYLRLTFSARRARLRIECGMGFCLRDFLVVPRSAHTQVASEGTTA